MNKQHIIPFIEHIDLQLELPFPESPSKNLEENKRLKQELLSNLSKAEAIVKKKELINNKNKSLVVNK